MRIRVAHGLHDLARDEARVTIKAARGGATAVRSNTKRGTSTMRGIARRASGPHGANYFKRISGEVKSPFVGEFGPTGDVSRAVGAGWRNGPPNTDSQKAADIIGPAFAKDVGKVLDGLFW